MEEETKQEMNSYQGFVEFLCSKDCALGSVVKRHDNEEPQAFIFTKRELQYAITQYLWGKL